jgi:hypothetical protein
MSKVNLTKAEAWEKIAMAYYQMSSERNTREEDMASLGICHALKVLRRYGYLNNEDCNSIEKIVMRDVDGYWKAPHYSYFCECNLENNFLRADYCWLQKCIEEARDE